jgi:molecular chaperone GrpE
LSSPEEKDGLIDENETEVQDGAGADRRQSGDGGRAEDDPRAETGLEPAGPAPAVGPEEAAALQRENRELRDQLLRRRAEFDNYRKRVERERKQAGLDAVADLLEALVPTLDNLDRAVKAEGTEQSLREGLELIHRELLAMLESRGVVADDPAGKRFDPNRHQALAHETAPDAPEGTVVEVFGKGYAIGDRLLRPAIVKVAKGAADGTGEGGPETLH